MLKESPSPALRSCLTLAQDYYPLVRQLFNAGQFSLPLTLSTPLSLPLSTSLTGFFLILFRFILGFISCWNELDETSKHDLMKNLEKALFSPNIPAEILQTLLNLCEFMENEEKRCVLCSESDLFF